MGNPQLQKALELKDLANECIKDEKYTEAILHYTHAIKLNKHSSPLYSNRSLAFLKLQQYYYALQDARETLSVEPTWFKGYFRLAEVEFAVGHYLEALVSYQRAYQLHPDLKLLECIIRTGAELQKQKKNDAKIPWLSCGIALIVGVILVIMDALLPQKSTFQHPIIQVLVSIVISLAGLGLGYAIRWYVISQRKSLLDPPPNLLEEQNEDNSNKENGTTKNQETRHHPRYTKAQARQRYRKGKS